MTEKDEVLKSREFLVGHFSLEENEIALDLRTFDQLEEQLTKTINYLLDKDMSRLLNALYRIDINEKTFKEILCHELPNRIGRRLSKEVIKRELEKVRTRAKYAD